MPDMTDPTQDPFAVGGPTSTRGSADDAAVAVDGASTETAEQTVQEADLAAAESYDDGADDAGDEVAEDAGVDTAPVAAVPAADDETSGDAAGEDDEDDDVDPVEEFKAQLRRSPGEWFVIHSYAGYENRVKANLETRITSLTMEDYIFQVEVPMEEVNEVKNGQRKAGAPGAHARVRPRAHGPHRRVVGRRAPHARRDGLRRQHPPAGAAEHRRGVLDAGAHARGQGEAGPEGRRAGARRRLRGRRVGHRHGGPLRDPPGHHLRDQPRRAEAQGARLHLRPRDAGRACRSARSPRSDAHQVGRPRLNPHHHTIQ
nr:transcription termination/antitermination NusG family protein [Angustibacter aerolatus]